MKLTVTVLLDPPSPVFLLGVIVDTTARRNPRVAALPAVVVDATVEEQDR